MFGGGLVLQYIISYTESIESTPFFNALSIDDILTTVA